MSRNSRDAVTEHLRRPRRPPPFEIGQHIVIRSTSNSEERGTVTPHIAGSSPTVSEECLVLQAENVIRVLSGLLPYGLASPQTLKTIAVMGATALIPIIGKPPQSFFFLTESEGSLGEQDALQIS